MTVIDCGDYPMRSLYFEQPSRGAKPTVFEAEYLHASYARYRPIDRSPAQPTAAAKRPGPSHHLSETAASGRLGSAHKS